MSQNRNSSTPEELEILPPAVKKLFSKSEGTVLTGLQKTTIIAAWGLLKKNLHQHSRNCFALFFEKHSEYVNQFGFTDSPDLINNKAMHAHATVVFNSIGSLIEEGFNDSELFQNILRKIVRNHRIRSISIKGDEVKKLTDVIAEYIGTELGQQKTTSLDMSLQTFFDTIANAFDEYDDMIAPVYGSSSSQEEVVPLYERNDGAKEPIEEQDNV